MRTGSLASLKANVHRAFAIFFVVVAVGTFAFAQKDYSIGEIQGDKNTSPHEGENVRASGIVTAVTRTGFFLQTPDDKADGNPATSEGIFVFTKNAPPADCMERGDAQKGVDLGIGAMREQELH